MQGLVRIHAIAKSRFDRAEAERSGAHVLIDLLREHLNLEIEYDPYLGTLFVKTPDGRKDGWFFGRMLDKVSEIAKHWQCSLEEAHSLMFKVLSEAMKTDEPRMRKEAAQFFYASKQFEDLGEDYEALEELLRPRERQFRTKPGPPDVNEMVRMWKGVAGGAGHAETSRDSFPSRLLSDSRTENVKIGLDQLNSDVQSESSSGTISSGSEMPTVDVTRVAKFLNVTPRRVQQLVKEGMPRGARGQYEAIKCAAWYVRYLQAAIEKKTTSTGDGAYTTLQEERSRLLHAKTELKQIELAKKLGTLVLIADVERELTELVLTTKARILGIPARVAGEIVGETSRVMIQARLQKAAEEALEPMTRHVSNHSSGRRG